MMKHKKALKYTEKSCAVAEGQNAKYEYAQSSLVLAQLAYELRLPESAAQIEEAEAALEPFEKMIEGAASRNSLIDPSAKTGGRPRSTVKADPTPPINIPLPTWARNVRRVLRYILDPH
jgi:hypothetical protein